MSPRPALLLLLLLLDTGKKKDTWIAGGKAIKLCSFSMTPVCIGSQNRIGFLQVTSWVYPAEKLISSAKGIAAMALE